MAGTCKVVIKPTIQIGRVPTIVESVLPRLFDDESVVMESESIKNDKKKYFFMRLQVTKVLAPIVERIIKNEKEVVLGIQLLDNGKLKIFQLADTSVIMPSEDPYQDDGEY
jgi:hypothetical protein